MKVVIYMYDDIKVNLVVEDKGIKGPKTTEQIKIEKRNEARLERIQNNLKKAKNGKIDEKPKTKKKRKTRKNRKETMLSLYVYAKREYDREIERKEYKKFEYRKKYFDYLVKNQDNPKIKLTENRKELMINSIENNENLRDANYLKYLFSKTYEKEKLIGLEDLVEELSENIYDHKYQKLLREYYEFIRKQHIKSKIQNEEKEENETENTR